jgi:Uncharacterized protein conserved in bacteria
MRVLLDTHVLLWWLAGERLSKEAIEVIGDPTNEVCVSAATVWELSIKRQLGKVEMPDGLAEQCSDEGFRILVIDGRHAELAGSLPLHHTDPFDRMLIAQAQLDTLIIVTRDRAFAAYGVQVLAA